MEQVQSLTAQALGGLEMALATFTSHEFPLHAHDEYVIGAVLDGAKASRHGARELVVRTGSLTLFNPYEEHTSSGLGGPWTFVALYPTAEHLRDWLASGSEPPRFRQPVAHDVEGVRLVASLFHRLARPSTVFEAQSAFVETLEHFAERHMESPVASVGEGPARRTRQRLDAALHTDASLADLAAAEGVSAAALLRGFRSAFGCTPRVYLTARRIAVAKRALRRRRPLAEIAADLGFCDQAHFTRVFQRWTGATPGAFAKA